MTTRCATRVACCRSPSSATGVTSSRRTCAFTNTRTAGLRSSTVRCGSPTMSRTEPRSIRSPRPDPRGKSASQQAYGRRGRALLTHPAHRASAPERTFDVLRRPDIFTCSRQRSAVAVALAGAALDDLGPLLAFAVGVCPSVDGVLQNRDDVAVADRRPIERDQLRASRRSGKVDLIGRRREMHAASAAELPKSPEDLTDGFLDAQIGIEAEAEIAMPDVSDRHADAQLATPCLGPSGLKHPGAQNAELELADAALHAQEQTVVRATRIVDPLEVNDARFDEPAQFEQVMPAPGDGFGLRIPGLLSNV